jgi:hypothetical protein
MSHKYITKVVWYVFVQLSSLIKKIPSTKIGKSQITKYKYQMVRQAHHPEPSRKANHNGRNSKYQTFDLLVKSLPSCHCERSEAISIELGL